MKPVGCLLVCLSVILCAPQALAGKISFDTEYVVTLRGFIVARASFTGKVDDRRYEVDGKLASAGIARVFARTDATAQSEGEMADGAAQPQRFLLDYAQDDWRSKTSIAFRNGDAVGTEVIPRPEKPSDKVIPITPADLKSVTDPVAATLLARGTPQQLCGRTLRVYEGGTRVDVALSLKSVGFVYGAGNHAVTCLGRFIPVAGMERGNASYEFMRRNADMEFVYVPATNDGLYMLYSLSSRTEIGRVQLRAWRRKVTD